MPVRKFFEYFAEYRVPLDGGGPEYIPSSSGSLPPLIAFVVGAGACSYLDCRENLSLIEVARLRDVLVERYNNERRATAAAEREAKRSSRSR